MFFFIAGIQPKTVDVDGQPRICSSCGLSRARLRRVDHYASLFFLPVFRVRKGVPFLECKACGSLSGESGQVWSEPQETPARICPHCGNPLQPEYRYCPFCGFVKQ